MLINKSSRYVCSWRPRGTPCSRRSACLAVSRYLKPSLCTPFWCGKRQRKYKPSELLSWALFDSLRNYFHLLWHEYPHSKRCWEKKVQGYYSHTAFIIRCVETVLKSWRMGNLRLSSFLKAASSLALFSVIQSPSLNSAAIKTVAWKKCRNNLKWTESTWVN